MDTADTRSKQGVKNDEAAGFTKYDPASGTVTNPKTGASSSPSLVDDKGNIKPGAYAEDNAGKFTSGGDASLQPSRAMLQDILKTGTPEQQAGAAAQLRPVATSGVGWGQSPSFEDHLQHVREATQQQNQGINAPGTAAQPLPGPQTAPSAFNISAQGRQVASPNAIVSSPFGTGQTVANPFANRVDNRFSGFPNAPAQLPPAVGSGGSYPQLPDYSDLAFTG